MLLKRLPALPQALGLHLPLLENVGILTTDHLLATAPASLRALVPDSVPDSCLQYLTELSLAAVAPATVPYKDTLAGPSTLWQGFGLEGLDDLIPEQGYGDWHGSGMIELSGTKSSGKTLFALHLALRYLVAEKLASCHWIDVDGSFSSNRARAILEAWEIENPTAVLDRVSVHPCFSLERDMPGILDVISTRLYGLLEGATRPGVIVIDPVTNLFRNVLNNASSQGHALMVTLLEDLAELTYTHSLLTLLINTTVSSLPTNPSSVFSTTSTKPALGASFTFHIDISLLLQDSARVFPMDEGERERAHSKEGGTRGVVEVLKNRMGPSGLWAMFETDGVRLLDVIVDARK